MGVSALGSGQDPTSTAGDYENPNELTSDVDIRVDGAFDKGLRQASASRLQQKKQRTEPVKVVIPSKGSSKSQYVVREKI